MREQHEYPANEKDAMEKKTFFLDTTNDGKEIRSKNVVVSNNNFQEVDQEKNSRKKQ